MKVKNDEYMPKCPFCDSKDLRSLGLIKYPEENFFSTTLVDLEKESSLVACDSCKSKFIQNRIPEETAYKLYQESSSNKRWPNVEPVEQTKNIEIINILNKYFLDKKTVVDVGCNIGLLLDFAKSRGLKTIGIELSEESKSILLSKGHEVYDSLDCVKDGSVDVITAFDLVEHLYNVNTFIESCYKKLSKNGVLIILTGNPSSLSATLSGKNWWYIKYPEHIVFPSKEYYKNLTNFNLCKYHQTYASKVYKVAFHKILLFFIKGFIKKMLFSFEYNGLPSLGPDHHLVVLKK